MEGFGVDGEPVNGHFKPFVSGPTVAIKFETEPYHDSGVVTDQGYYGDGLQYGTAVYQTVYNPDYSNSTEVPLSTGQPFYNGVSHAAPSETGDAQISQVTPTKGGTAETTCDICDKKFSSNASMRRHREIHTGVKKFSCDLCGNSYTQKHNLTKHMRLHTGEKPYKCRHCEKEFYILHHLKNHLALHGEAPFRCETCGKAYKHKYKMEAHIRATHSGGTSGGSVAQSPTSGMTSDDNSMSEPWTNGIDEDGSEADNHDDDEDYYEGMDDGETTYDEHECEVCQAIFINEESLNNHMKLQHSVDQEYRCDKCSNIFLTRAHLVRHRRSHTGEQIFECKECNVSFRWKVSLHIHMRRHNNDFKRYECTLCNKYFLAKESLRRHQTTVHLGVNSYECEECGEKFTQKSDYKNHLLAHDSTDIKTNKKPATAEQQANKPKSEPKAIPTCKTCHKTFSSNSSLRKHEYTHMDEKPHKCELCNVSFAQKIQLRLHNKKHNGGKMEPPSQPPYTKKTQVSPAKKVEKRNDFKDKDGSKSSENSLDSSENSRSSRSPSPAKNSQISTSSPTKLRIRLEKLKTEPVVPERRNAARKARQMFKAMEEDEEDEEEEEESEEDDDEEEEEEENGENKRRTRLDGYRYPTCDNCGKRFKKNKALNRHLKFCKQK
ncbi:zinc finger protein ZFP2-like isoform X2 [Dreissena polymorpha]|uniref:zinc finger protein ZFP2-like isoform X2 n=1 Tax=Dreissena polymorpha TaxID=45954 RepID=UPI00226475F3|nr:zinc finger protein ZFP2-like isoform X2 [Dreissena polymorpha]